MRQQRSTRIKQETVKAKQSIKLKNISLEQLNKLSGGYQYPCPDCPDIE